MYNELDRNLTKDQELLKKEAHRFAEEVIRPAAAAVDQMKNPEDIIKKDSVLWEAKRKAKQAKYHLAGLPKSVGGFEADPVEFHILLEEFGWGSVGFALSVFLDTAPAAMALMYQPENKKLMNEVVIPFIEDEDAKLVPCTAIAEPDHGADATLCFTRHYPDTKLAFDTKAVLDGDEWVISGQKAAWVSNGAIATHAMTFVSIYQGEEIAGGGVALVPMDLPGVTRGNTTELLGSRDYPQCEIFYDDVRIPKDYMFVRPDSYEIAADQLLNMAGLVVATACTGLARASFEEALKYSKQRIQGGKVIVDHQLTKSRLFDMFTKVETARAYSRAAAGYCLTTNPPPVEYSAAAKVHCTQVAFEVAHEAVQIHGAYGLTNNYLVEKLFRDARCYSIADCCNEVLSLKRAHNILENYKL